MSYSDSKEAMDREIRYKELLFKKRKELDEVLSSQVRRSEALRYAFEVRKPPLSLKMHPKESEEAKNEEAEEAEYIKSVLDLAVIFEAYILDSDDTWKELGT